MLDAPVECTRRLAEWRSLLEEAASAADYSRFLALCRRRNRLAADAPPPPPARSVRLALLGGASTDLIEAPLSLALESLGLGCEVHRSDYNTFAREMLDASSATVAFGPEVAVVVNTPANIPSWPEPGASLEQAGGLAREVCDYWLGLCSRLHEHAGCEIILNNFHALPTRPLGSLAAKVPWDRGNFLRRVNRELGDRAPSYVHLHDVESLAAWHGVAAWFDPRYWFHARQPVSFDCLVPYVRSTARLIAALYGRSAKCVVLDLDNTLWGGVVGDDGPEGISVGEGDAVSEAYGAFQQYLLMLKQRGVLLAVCSKNEEASALAAFAQRTEMPLKRSDFVAFKANWQPKADNIRRIAEELNLGLESLVFVDDNPVERDQVRSRLPEVAVIELTDDPADYPRLLDQAGLFEITALSAEDGERTGQYQANQLRQELCASTADYAGYLAGLRQRAVLRPFEERHLDRITQLTNKTNQFNLTTLRMSRTQVEAWARDRSRLTAYVRLADRFGDNGLVAVWSARSEEGALWIDQWLMSCRVFNRGVEQLLCNHAVERARALGLQSIHGIYLPTQRNGVVRDLYAALGFAPAGEDDSGATRWRLEVAEYLPFPVPIELVEDY